MLIQNKFTITYQSGAPEVKISCDAIKTPMERLLFLNYSIVFRQFKSYVLAKSAPFLFFPMTVSR